MTKQIDPFTDLNFDFDIKRVFMKRPHAKKKSIRCHKCGAILKPWMQEEGYETIYRCHCGEMNYVEI